MIVEKVKTQATSIGGMESCISIKQFRHEVDIESEWVSMTRQYADDKEFMPYEIEGYDTLRGYKVYDFDWFAYKKRQDKGGEPTHYQFRCAMPYAMLTKRVSQVEEFSGAINGAGFLLEVADVYKDMVLLKPTTQRHWAWLTPCQQWFHQSCNAYVTDEGFCPICGTPTPHCFTRRQLHDRIHKTHLDEEYFEVQEDYTKPDYDYNNEQLWTDNTAWIAVYVVKGGSEGFYVHVDRLDRIVNGRTMLLLGKYFDLEKAEEAVRRISRWVYDM